MSNAQNITFTASWLLESQVYYCMLPAVEQQQGIEFTIITLVLQHDAGRV